jgi:hypothetical protein
VNEEPNKAIQGTVTSAASLTSIVYALPRTLNIHDYLIDQTGLDWPSLLEEWHWLLPPKFTVWLLTRAGDLFIKLPDGSIHMLEVGSGKLSRVADSRADACTKIDEAGVANEWLMIPVVDQLVTLGCVLGPGQCYSYKMLPILGGSYAPEGRALLPIRKHFGLWGSLHRKVSGLSDGTEIEIKVTD